MVSIPPYPPIPRKPEVEVTYRKPRQSTLSKAYELLDKFTPEQKTDLYFWLAEQPLPIADPVRLAMASFNGLKEDELPNYFEQMRDSLARDVWALLTED